MPVILRNNAVSRLAAALTASATTLSVTAGQGGLFPPVAAGDWFPVTIIKADGTLEICRCTGRNGDVLTVARAQEGTAAQTFAVGDRVELRLTMAAMAEFVQLANANTWPNSQYYNAVNYHRSAIQLSNGTIDSPEIWWNTPSWNARADIAGNVWRIFIDQGGPAQTAFHLALDTKFGYLFDREVLTKGSDGVTELGPILDLHAIGDASDWTCRLATDAGGVLYTHRKGAGSARVWTGYDFDIAQFPRRGALIDTNAMFVGSGAPPNIAAISSSGNGDNVPLTVHNFNNTGASAVMQFFRGGQYAAYFGLDTDNLWKVGGRSMGNVAYPVWHDGMDYISRVRNAMTDIGTGGIGTYGLFVLGGGGGTGPGEIVYGQNMRYAATGWISGAAPGGTWRIMGAVLNTDGASTDSITLCQRIS